MLRHAFVTLFAIILLSGTLAACDGQFEILTGRVRTVVAPQAATLAAQGGKLAGTQASRLLQTAQSKVATESADLKETAKVEAATAAGSLIDTAQARLVTQSAGQVTAAPTQLKDLKDTAQALLATQIALRAPALQTQAAELGAASEARLATEAATRFPFTLTQVAIFNETVQAGLAQVTQTPPVMITQVQDWLETAQAQVAPILNTPLPPDTPPARLPVSTVVYLVRTGDTLSQIASLFDMPVERLVYLNQLRLPWLASSPQNLTPGLALVVAREPDDGAPVTPVGLAAWSGVPGCDVSQVDWLIPPLDCRPAEIDVVSKIDLTAGCIGLNNPLGYTLRHEILTGWMLSGVDGSQSYGWFADRDRNAMIVGPAIVVDKVLYSECRVPGNR